MTKNTEGRRIDEDTFLIKRNLPDGNEVVVTVTIYGFGEGHLKVMYPGRMTRNYPINRMD